MMKHDVTALVSSRICHDLISPIGAISNGVELLSDGPGRNTPELGLIGDSVNTAAAKLKYFRIAFGSSGEGARVPLSELAAATGAMFQGRSSVDLQIGAPDVSRVAAKALLLLLLCQERCLPLGGLSRVLPKARGFRIETGARKLRDAAELWRFVENADAAGDLAPSDVQFLLLGDLLRTEGATLARHIGPDFIELDLDGLRP